MGPGILPETTVGKPNPPCHLQMPTKAVSRKKEAICEHGPEAPPCPVGQCSFKMDCFKVEMCSMIRRVQIWHSCWKSWTPCTPGWRGGRPSSMLSAFSSKASISEMTTNSSAAGNLSQARMGPNSTKTPETHNLDAQTSSYCFEKKRRCYTRVNMTFCP